VGIFLRFHSSDTSWKRTSVGGGIVGVLLTRNRRRRVLVGDAPRAFVRSVRLSALSLLLPVPLLAIPLCLRYSLLLGFEVFGGFLLLICLSGCAN
jgi:hypothetical protein